MSMEVMAAEFPDIYQQFLEPQPSPIDAAEVESDWGMFSSNKTRSKGIVNDSNKNQKFQLSGEQTSRASYSSMNITNMTGTTKTNSVNALKGFVLTTGIQPDASGNKFTEVELNTLPSEFADIDDILATLEQIDNDRSTNSQLDLAKSAFGRQWSDYFMCPHGDSCPFITQYLGLADLPEPAAVPAQPPRVTSVVVLRQTPNGLIKLQETLMPLGQEEVKRLQAMTPQEQVSHLGLNTAQLRQEKTKQVIGNTSSSTLQLREQGGQYVQPSNTAQYIMTQYTVPMSNQTTYNAEQFSVPVSASQGQYSAVSSASAQNTTLSTSNIKYRSSGSVPYRPPPNAVLVKVPTSVLQNQSSYQFSFPTPSPSPPTISALSPSNPKYPLLCSECDTQFHDSKSLVKHTRNQHQVYQCNKCGEETAGYYRMASHTKKNHSKEPAFFCPCGRNFSEKRGLTKHQNSCSFYNPQ